MKVYVNEEMFWKLRGDESIMYYVEDDIMVHLYLPRNGHFICSNHMREDAARDDEDADNPNMYLVWKQEKLLGGAIKAVKVEDSKTILEVKQ